MGWTIRVRGFDSWWGLEIFFSTEFRPSLGLTQPPIPLEPRALYAGVKRPGHHSPPGVEIKNAWSYTCTHNTSS